MLGHGVLLLAKFPLQKMSNQPQNQNHPNLDSRLQTHKFNQWESNIPLQAPFQLWRCPPCLLGENSLLLCWLPRGSVAIPELKMHSEKTRAYACVASPVIPNAFYDQGGWGHLITMVTNLNTSNLVFLTTKAGDFSMDIIYPQVYSNLLQIC